MPQCICEAVSQEGLAQTSVGRAVPRPDAEREKMICDPGAQEWSTDDCSLSLLSLYLSLSLSHRLLHFHRHLLLIPSTPPYPLSIYITPRVIVLFVLLRTIQRPSRLCNV
jgi:hypothetical protein